jgi:prepilin-type N-terminal cleavage/methylation domain-containing protein/prepilin-type processing-associated H-X9-DG protein
MKSRKAFTLTELLVVLGIIALLVGILLPVVARAQKQGKIVACKAQLQNIGAAVQMYLNQNRHRYPPASLFPSVRNPPAGEPRPITEFLRPHVGGTIGVFHCPADDHLFDEFDQSFSYNTELGLERLKETSLYKIMGSTSLIPVLWDSDNFHGGSLPFNWLFADGHVDNFLKDVVPKED